MFSRCKSENSLLALLFFMVYKCQANSFHSYTSCFFPNVHLLSWWWLMFAFKWKCCLSGFFFSSTSSFLLSFLRYFQRENKLKSFFLCVFCPGFFSWEGRGTTSSRVLCALIGECCVVVHTHTNRKHNYKYTLYNVRVSPVDVFRFVCVSKNVICGQVAICLLYRVS